MAEKNSQLCLEHTGVVMRLERLEEDVKELRVLLKDKVEASVLEDIIARRTKEIEDLKAEIIRLSASDIKQAEALAGIHAILKEFKDSQETFRKDIKESYESLRQDNKVLSQCYTEQARNIAAITAILAERAKKIGGESKDGKDPWYARLLIKHKPAIYIACGVIGFLLYLVTSKWNDIVSIIMAFAK